MAQTSKAPTASASLRKQLAYLGRRKSDSPVCTEKRDLRHAARRKAARKEYPLQGSMLDVPQSHEPTND